jgi:hypothetical protein
MLKKLSRYVQKLVRTKKAVDPSMFGDPIAETTQWSPAKRGGANFCTHKLVEIATHRMEFRASLGAKLFCLFFFLVGVGIITALCYGIISQGKNILTVETFGTGLGGTIFMAVGACLFYFGLKPVVFDKHSGHFWKGRRNPDLVFNKDSIKTWTQLGKIHALQLISEHVSSSKSSYYSYELNLVLEDGERLNVIDHGKLTKIREDANTLSQFLGKPVWDAI